MIKLLCSRWHLAIVALLACAGSALGQVVVGAKVGLNLNQFSQPGTTVGFNGGVYASYQATPAIAVRFEPHYSMEGGGRPDYNKNYSELSDNVYSITYMNPYVVFHNVQIPLLVELTLPEFSEETVKPKLILGGSYGLMVAATETATKRYEFTEESTGSSSGSSTEEPTPLLDVSYQREPATDNYARNQWNLWFGMGLEFEAGERTFSFDVRYRQGLNNLNLLRFASPGNASGTTGTAGTGGELFSSTVSFNFSVSIFTY
jgi:hypothetical protein